MYPYLTHDIPTYREVILRTPRPLSDVANAVDHQYRRRRLETEQVPNAVEEAVGFRWMNERSQNENGGQHREEDG